MAAIALICTANRCRSVMAHAIFVDEARKRSLTVDVYSAGVIDCSDQPPVSETSRTCLHFNTPPPRKPPTWVHQLPIEKIKRFLVMERDHAETLTREFGILPDRISLLGTFDPQRRGAEIDDPFFSHNEQVYKRVYEQIRDCIVGYLETTDELRSEPPAVAGG
jgi:protein-tyrosine-phosphatase